MANKKKTTRKWKIHGKEFTAPSKMYKNENRYIRRVYNLNKQSIDDAYEGVPVGQFETFKEKVKQFMEEGNNMRDAVKKVFKTTSFATEEEISQSNIDKYLTGQRKQFKQMVNINTKEKLDMSKFKWDDQQGAYIYDNSNHGVEFTPMYNSATGQYSISLRIF